MTVLIELLLLYLAAVNVLAFVLYGVDKFKARQGRWRISEATLLLTAVLGGALGAWVGMLLWHHKTLHPRFRYGLPLLVLAWLVLLTWIYPRL